MLYIAKRGNGILIERQTGCRSTQFDWRIG